MKERSSFHRGYEGKERSEFNQGGISHGEPAEWQDSTGEL